MSSLVSVHMRLYSSGKVSHDNLYFLVSHELLLFLVSITAYYSILCKLLEGEIRTSYRI